MKSATSYAREQRPVERYKFKANAGISNPLRPRQRPKKKQKTEPLNVTDGDWYSTGTAVASDTGETIALASFGLHTDLPRRRRDMKLLASAKTLYGIVQDLAGAKPEQFGELVQRAKEVIGGVA